MQRISVYNINLERIGLILSWVSLLWEDCYNTLGNFQLEVQQTEENCKLLKPWTYFKLDDNDHIMLATSVQLRNKKIVVRGYPAIYILQKRVSDMIISDINAEEALFKLVDSISPWENFSTGSKKGLNIKYKNQISDKSILEYCESIAQETDIGFYVRKQRNLLLFECYKPELNSSIKASERYGNLSNLIYNINENNHYNVAVVSGMKIDNSKYQEFYEEINFDVSFPNVNLFVAYNDGINNFIAELTDECLIVTLPDEQNGYVGLYELRGEINANIYDRFTVEVGETDSYGYLRREIYVDARDVQLNENDGETMEQYAERLRLRGLQKLAELLRVETVEYDIDDDRAKLGDLISISIPQLGIKAISRIVSDKYKSQNNYLQRTVKVGQPMNILALASLRGIKL